MGQSGASIVGTTRSNSALKDTAVIVGIALKS